MMAAPQPYCPRISSVTVSAENVEKVVSPPRKPVVTSNRTSGTNQITANKVGGKRAQRQFRNRRVEPQAQAVA